MKDTIVEEVRTIRETLAAKHKFNIHSISEDARRHQTKSGHKIIRIAHGSFLKSEKLK